MQVGWLIDAVAFDAYHAELASAVTRNGHKAVSVTRPSPPYQWDDANCSYRKSFPRGSCVIVHGDVDLVRRVQSEQLWNPGVFATIPHYFCSYYYPRLSQFLLNDSYVMLPFGDLPRRKDFLFQCLGKNDLLFVRLDSPLKMFTGQTISLDEFDKDYEFIGFNEFPIETIIVVSVAQKLVAEWRFIIADGRIVAGSQYKDGGELVAVPATDAGAFAFTDQIVSTGYHPDPVWVLDIGLVTDGRYRVVETGGFSFAGLYACDKDAVVQAVSSAARAIHTSNRG